MHGLFCWFLQCREHPTTQRLTFLFVVLPEESAADQPSPEQIKMEMEKWVQRCKVSAVIGTATFVAWIVIAQVLRGSVFPHQLYFTRPDNAELTGW
jgi:hypothetical protein